MDDEIYRAVGELYLRSYFISRQLADKDKEIEQLKIVIEDIKTQWKLGKENTSSAG